MPRKNIREFNGKPLIAWSIAAAQSSGLFERIIVSTDDEEIGSISKEYGAEVPFKRPPELSNDFTGTDAVVSHALDWLVEQKFVPDFICCIYPTAPLLTGQTIIQVLNALHESEASSAFVACTFAHPVWRGMSLVEEDTSSTDGLSIKQIAHRTFRNLFTMLVNVIGCERVISKRTPG